MFIDEAKNQVSELKKLSETLKEDLTKTKESLKKVETCDKSNKVCSYSTLLKDRIRNEPAVLKLFEF